MVCEHLYEKGSGAQEHPKVFKRKNAGERHFLYNKVIALMTVKFLAVEAHPMFILLL